MAAAATNAEAGEITLQSLQLYHRKDGTPYMLGAGSFGMVGVLGVKRSVLLALHTLQRAYLASLAWKRLFLCIRCLRYTSEHKTLGFAGVQGQAAWQRRGRSQGLQALRTHQIRGDKLEFVCCEVAGFSAKDVRQSLKSATAEMQLVPRLDNPATETRLSMAGFDSRQYGQHVWPACKPHSGTATAFAHPTRIYCVAGGVSAGGQAAACMRQRERGRVPRRLSGRAWPPAHCHGGAGLRHTAAPSL